MTELADTAAPHAFRISLNLTRRVVRRLIEEANKSARPQPWGKPRSVVPDATSFRASVRVLKRSLRRMMDMAECVTAPGPCPTLTLARCPARRG